MGAKEKATQTKSVAQHALRTFCTHPSQPMPPTSRPTRLLTHPATTNSTQPLTQPRRPSPSTVHSPAHPSIPFPKLVAYRLDHSPFLAQSPTLRLQAQLKRWSQTAPRRLQDVPGRPKRVPRRSPDGSSGRLGGWSWGSLGRSWGQFNASSRRLGECRATLKHY